LVTDRSGARPWHDLWVISANDPSTSPLGWDAEWAESWTEALSESSLELVPIRVVRIDKGGITASPTSGVERLVVAAKSARRVVVGDVCGMDPDAGRIEVILPRRTVFERRSPGVGRDQVQVTARPLASNMDLVLVLQGLDQGVNEARLARELVLAWESGAMPVVVLTKTDLVDAGEVDAARRSAQRWAPGVTVVCVSSRSPEGLSELLNVLGDPGGRPPHVVALLGASGAGKSSLVNSLAGRQVQLTAEVREGDHRGRHTTTAGQMVTLPSGDLIIDTPGIRGVGLWAADDGLEQAFADLAPFAESCKFGDCTHQVEPGCGLLAALEAGLADSDRVAVWHQLVAELESLEAGLELLDRDTERQGNQRARSKSRRRDASAGIEADADALDAELADGDGDGDTELDDGDVEYAAGDEYGDGAK